MKLIAQITGFFAVATFLLSYQIKKKNNMIFCNALSRGLYILQYILLGAFEGAALDILGLVCSVVAAKKDKLKKHWLAVAILLELFILIVGIIFYKNIFSLFAIVGVMLHTGAFWLEKESTIRKVSFLGSPFWFVFNFSASAWGSALGDVLTMVSIALAIFRYDFKGKNKNV